MVKSNNLDALFNRRIPEIETLNMWEEHEFIDSPFVEIPNIVKLGKETKIIGFENHGGQTFNIDTPLGDVLYGNGNKFGD